MTEKKQSGASLGLQKRNSFITYLVHLLDHFCEFLVVLQNFVELSHRVGAELVEKTRHFLAVVVCFSSPVLSLLAVQIVTAD